MRKLSAEARAKIAAAQKARWANQKGASAGPATALVMEAEKSAKKARGRFAAGANAAKAERKKPLISKEVLARMAAKARELKRVR
jgi:hypothetical protein